MVKNKAAVYFNICTLFVILWGFYGFHWYDTAKGSLIDNLSIVFLGINLAISLVCVVFIILFRRTALPSYFSGVRALLIVFFIYGGLYLIGGESHYLGEKAVNKGSYLIGILRSYLPLYAFYYFSLKGYINYKSITLYFVVLLAFSLLYDLLFSRYWVSIGYDDGFTNNLGYVFVSFFPFVFLYEKRPLLQYLILAFIIGITISSMKRGAILISIILLLWFLFVSVSRGRVSKRLVILVLSGLLLVVGYLFVVYLYKNSSYFQIRIEETIEGDGSGRDMLYFTLWDHYWNETNWFQKVFGSGANSTFAILGKEAHNDWLEILTCQGLFGVIIYAFFWVNSLVFWRRMSKNSIYYKIVGAFIITQFLRTLYSMSYSTIPTAATLILGYSIAMSELQKQSV